MGARSEIWGEEMEEGVVAFDGYLYGGGGGEDYEVDSRDGEGMRTLERRETETEMGERSRVSHLTCPMKG